VPKHYLFLHVVTREQSAGEGGRGSERASSLGDGLSSLGVPWSKGSLEFVEGYACQCEYEAGQGFVGHKEILLDSDGNFWRSVLDGIGEREHLWVIGDEVGIAIRILNAIESLSDSGFAGDRFFATDTCTFVSFRKGMCKVKFLDSQNVWRAGLKDLAQLAGVAPLPGPAEADGSTSPSTFSKWAVNVLMDAWGQYLRFVLDHDLGEFAITVGSQAANAFRHRFMDTEIGISDDANQTDIERDAYHGGRCSVFRLGLFENDTYYKLDINGAYAWAMHSYPYPAKAVLQAKGYSAKTLRNLLEHHLAIAEVILETDTPAYPIKIGRRPLYPVGTFKATLSTPELRKALDDGSVKAVGRVMLYEKAMLFTDFVTFFTDKRQEFKKAGNKIWEMLCKRFLNSLYGKFGQRGYSQKRIGDAPPGVVYAFRLIDGDTGNWCWQYAFGGKVIIERQSDESADSFPAIPSHVTAYLRLHLFRLIEQAGRENVFYTDTDALVVNQAGYNRLADELHPTQSGKLKVEGQGDRLKIWGGKWYELGGKLTSAGIKGDAVRVGRTRFVQCETQSLKASFVAKDARTVRSSRVGKRFSKRSTAFHTDQDGVVLTPRLGLSAAGLMEIVAPTGTNPQSVWWVNSDWAVNLALTELGGQGVVVLDTLSPKKHDCGPKSNRRPSRDTCLCRVGSRQFDNLDEAFDYALQNNYRGE